MKRNLRESGRLSKPQIFGIIILAGLCVLAAFGYVSHRSQTQTAANTPRSQMAAPAHPASSNPLAGLTFYRDTSDEIVALTNLYKHNGRQEEAALLSKISSQPIAIWLNGPNQSDPSAQADIAEVKRTSQAAAAQGTTPIYMLYAIPLRDACATYSNGGFNSAAAYAQWVQNLVAATKTKSVFVVEPDAVPHAVQGRCLSPQQIDERYELLSDTVAALKKSPMTAAVYIDSGHSESFPDPAVLVEPLRRAGIQSATGVAVNVSNFIATPEITAWSARLIKLVGDDKGVIIDTSRNGKGAVDASVQGEARWCNPKGRGIGHTPTTDVADSHVDAYFWGKKPGESDGACFGNPAAGTLVPALALELARNAEQ